MGKVGVEDIGLKAPELPGILFIPLSERTSRQREVLASDRILDSEPEQLHPFPQPVSIEQIIDAARSYGISPDGLAKIRKAYDLAAKAHSGTLRNSGDPYIIHPLSVASYLANLHADADTLSAALLHDVAEDRGEESPEYSFKAIEENFGTDVACLVDGVTKISANEYSAAIEHILIPDTEGSVFQQRIAALRGQREKRSRQAMTLRYILDKALKDPRIMFIKLADRLHNMRTISANSARSISNNSIETMDILVPLASRYGPHAWKRELEDLAFQYINPEAFSSIQSHIESKGKDPALYVERTASLIQERLGSAGVSAHVSGRVKSVFAIFEELRSKGMVDANEHITTSLESIDLLPDFIAFQIEVKDEEDCYKALRLIQSWWPGDTASFRNYIKYPKKNGYKALHISTLCGDRTVRMRIQTSQMGCVNEYGAAVRWMCPGASWPEIREEEHNNGLKYLAQRGTLPHISPQI